MAKLTNKEHEIQQLNRIKKLENDVKQQKSRIDKLEKRIASVEEDESDLGITLLEELVILGDVLSYYQDAVVNENALSTAGYRKRLLVLKKKMQSYKKNSS
jgi:hypothetical protein